MGNSGVRRGLAEGQADSVAIEGRSSPAGAETIWVTEIPSDEESPPQLPVFYHNPMSNWKRECTVLVSREWSGIGRCGGKFLCFHGKNSARMAAESATIGTIYLDCLVFSETSGCALRLSATAINSLSVCSKIKTPQPEGRGAA